jgi:hypothetical protein
MRFLIKVCKRVYLMDCSCSCLEYEMKELNNRLNFVRGMYSNSCGTGLISIYIGQVQCVRKAVL